MARNKKVNLKEMSQTHGKEEKATPSTLDQIWGDTGLSKYQTLDESAYKTQLDDMNKSDLQTHATKLGLIPIDSRELLTQRLVREFRKYVCTYMVPELNELKSNITKDALKVLGEGK